VENHLLNIDQAQIWIQIFCYLYSPPFSVKHKAYLGRQQIPPIDTTLLSGMSSPWDTGHHRFCGFVVGRATPPDAIRDVLFLLPVDLFPLGHRASSLCCSFVVGRATPPDAIRDVLFLLPVDLPPPVIGNAFSLGHRASSLCCSFVVGRATPPDAIRDVLFLLPVDLPPPVIGNAFSLGHRASSLCCSFVVGRATPPDAIRDVLFLLPVNFPSSCEFPVWSFCPEGQLYGDFYLLG